MSGKNRSLKKKIDTYLEDLLVTTAILRDGIEDYLEGRDELFQRKVNELSRKETALDKLRREVEQQLYGKMLLPESRGDILGLLENLDDIANYGEEILKIFRAERPIIPSEYHKDFTMIMEKSHTSVRDLLEGVAGYFTNARFVNGLMAQVSYMEHEVDEVFDSLITRLFKNEELDLAHKMHIRYFAEKLVRLTDIAEDVSERVIISTLKREI